MVTYTEMVSFSVYLWAFDREGRSALFSEHRTQGSGRFGRSGETKRGFAFYGDNEVPRSHARVERRPTVHHLHDKLL